MRYAQEKEEEKARKEAEVRMVGLKNQDSIKINHLHLILFERLAPSGYSFGFSFMFITFQLVIYRPIFLTTYQFWMRKSSANFK